jgi:hypothetical protein
MKYEQAHALAAEFRRQMDDHAEAVGRGEYCPECKWHTEREHARCAEREAIWKSYASVMEAYPIARAHEKACPTCQTVVRQWEHLDKCEASFRLYEAWRICVHRMEHIRAKQERGVCAEPGCSKLVFPHLQTSDPQLCYRHLRKHDALEAVLAREEAATCQ